MPTKIEWCEESWNPVTGCTKISEGCKNCYAEKMAKRLAGRFGYPKDNPFKVTFHENKLLEPTKWRKSHHIFVCSMGDLFHPDVIDKQIDTIFRMMTHPMGGMNHHTYLILTKRPERILKSHYENFKHWKNIWLGVSVENQKTADKRIPILLKIPAKVRFVSVEPMLERIELREYLGMYKEAETITVKHVSDMPSEFQQYTRKGRDWVKHCGNKLDWLIAGGESGQHARPMHPDWVRKVRDNCLQTGTPFFFKQWGEWIQSEEPQEVYSKKDGFQTLPVKECFIKIGKKKAGRLLNGREWNQYPNK